MKLKYKLRNTLFPKRHDPLVREIADLQMQKLMWVDEKKKYLRLMEGGILGDTLWDNFMNICEMIKGIEKRLLIKNKK